MLKPMLKPKTELLIVNLFNMASLDKLLLLLLLKKLKLLSASITKQSSTSSITTKVF